LHENPENLPYSLATERNSIPNPPPVLQKIFRVHTLPLARKFAAGTWRNRRIDLQVHFHSCVKRMPDQGKIPGQKMLEESEKSSQFRMFAGRNRPKSNYDPENQ